jgi:glycosyltransferase involved in cell wall biosynthesis
MVLLPILKIVELNTFKYATHINLISEGFKDYFSRFKKDRLSFYSNGIDNEFIDNANKFQSSQGSNNLKLIVYAGNLGEGQGLHKIVPKAAKRLEGGYKFLIIGDGGAKESLLSELEILEVNNVIVHNPVDRNELMEIYNSADFLFLHLNDYPAFRKVLPSKIFELASFSKPILAGVSGYSAEFIQNEVTSSFVFKPCDVDMLVNHLNSYECAEVLPRTEFVNKFKRDTINKEMAESILSYL